jgi:hypothetical protein
MSVSKLLTAPTATVHKEPPMKKVTVLFVGGWLFAAAACAHRGHTAPTPSTAASPTQSVGIRYDTNGGAFGVRGAIQRLAAVDDKYVYLTQPTLVFNADGEARGTPVRLTRAVLTASVIDEAVTSTHRWVLFSDKQEIRAEFRTKGEERTLPELRFVLPKSVEEEAEYITLKFTDGQVVVPLVLNLKGYWR